MHLVEYSVGISPIDEAWTRYPNTEKQSVSIDDSEQTTFL